MALRCLPILCVLLLTCSKSFGQPSVIAISVAQPQEGAVVDTSVVVRVTMNSTYELQSVVASVGSLQTNLLFQNGNWTNRLDLTMATGGTNILIVTAQDIFGFTAQTQRTIIVDHPPVLTVLAPINHTVARSSLVYVDATATDDDSQNCTITVYDGYISFGQRRLQGNKVVKGFVATSGTLLFEATDQSGQSKLVVRQIIIERNSNLVEVAQAPGMILDFSESRFLYTFNPDPGRYDGMITASLSQPHVAIAHRDSGAVVQAPDITNRAAVRGFLTASGAFLVYKDYPNGPAYPIVAAWTGGILSNYGFAFPSLDVRLVNDIAVWPGPAQLTLRDANNPAKEFGIMEYRSWVLAANNDLLYTTGTSSAILRSRPVNPAEPFGTHVTTQLIANGGDLYRETDGTNVFYAGSQGLTLWTPTDEQTIVTNYGNYLINNGWVAFTRAGNVGQAQIWTRSPTGVFEQRTFYGSSSTLESLGPNGSLTFTNNSLTPKGRYIIQSGSPPWNIGEAKGWVRWTSGGDPLVVLGRSVFTVHAGELKLVSQANGTVQLAFVGPPGQNVQLQSSSNLMNWNNSMIFSNASGNVYLTNPATAMGQYFRTVVLP